MVEDTGTRLTGARMRAHKRHARTARVNLTCTPETKLHLKNCSTNLLMDVGEFVEWLIGKYAAGKVVVMEDGAFLDGLSKTLDDRARASGWEAGEKAALRVLYDHNLIDAEYLK